MLGARVILLAATTVVAAALSQAAAATLAKRAPVVIEVRAGTFTLAYEGAGSAAPDTGSAVATVKSGDGRQTGARLLDRVAATAVLEGRDGSLTLRWRGEAKPRTGRSSALVGTWSVVGGTGTYAAVTGRGSLTADPRLESVRYVGFLVTAL